MEEIGIIVLNWNGYEDTIECIESLLSNSYKKIKVILIDNDSKNNEGEMLNDYFGDKIIFIQNKKNSGFAGGCNLGIQKALSLGFEYILLFNNDAVAIDGFIEKLMEDMETNQNIGIIGPAITYYNKQNIIWFAGGDLNPIIGAAIHKFKGNNISVLNGLSRYDTGYASGCCMLISKKVFDTIGLFDEDYFAYNEEVDFCFRAKKSGFRCIIEPQSFIKHKKSASTGVAGKNYFTKIQSYLIARNGILFCKKNFTGIKMLWFLALQFTTLPILRLLFHIRSIKALKYYYFGLFNIKSLDNVLEDK